MYILILCRSFSVLTTQTCFMNSLHSYWRSTLGGLKECAGLYGVNVNAGKESSHLDFGQYKFCYFIFLGALRDVDRKNNVAAAH